METETYCDCGEMLFDALYHEIHLEMVDDVVGKCPGCGKPYAVSDVVG